MARGVGRPMAVLVLSDEENGRILNVRLDAAGSRARCPIAAA